MITKTDIEAEIYRRYILPTKGKQNQHIGVEFELPISNTKKQPVDFAVIHEMVTEFTKTFGFTEFKFDDEGNVCAAAETTTEDDISFDCSYNTLEFSFGRADDLNQIDTRFRKYYRFVSDFLRARDHRITGMGINPYYKYNRITPVPNGRYRMLLHHLSSYEKYAGEMLFHNIPFYGLIACSAQTHLDVEEQNLTKAINIFNHLEPLKALLFANSPSDHTYTCIRDHLWRESMHGLNPHNVDGWQIDLRSVDEIVAYIRSMSLYCTERDGKYINFRPMPLEEYFSSETVDGEYFDGAEYRKISWKPALDDLEYLRSFKFVDLTFRGTLEMRSTCMQPVGEALTPAAFHLGLMQKLDDLTALLDSASIYHQGFNPVELRKLFVRQSLPAFADPQELRSLLRAVVSLAENGLVDRGLGEEVFLEPLFRRADLVKSPAVEMIEGMKSGRTLEDYIETYGTL